MGRYEGIKMSAFVCVCVCGPCVCGRICVGEHEHESNSTNVQNCSGCCDVECCVPGQHAGGAGVGSARRNYPLSGEGLTRALASRALVPPLPWAPLWPHPVGVFPVRSAREALPWRSLFPSSSFCRAVGSSGSCLGTSLGDVFDGFPLSSLRQVVICLS